MGFSVTIAAIPLDQRQAFLTTAGVTVTDSADPYGDALVSVTETEAHFLLWRNLRKAPMFSEPDWEHLSGDAPMMVLDVVDTAGAQVLRYFESGRVAWEVSFQDSNDELLLISEGAPSMVATLRDGLKRDWLAAHPEDAEQDDLDLVAGYGMELPSRVFEEMTGIYYEDGVPEGLSELSSDLPQVKLSWSGKPKRASDRPWWKIW